MDIRNYIRPIIAGLVGIGLVILVIVLLSKALSGHGGTPANRVDVGKYADQSALVTLLVDAPTNVDQDHRQVKISVTNTQTEIDIYQGYQDTLIDSRTYANNNAAFGAFLQSLKLQNFSKGKNDSALKDYRGYCPTGDRYVFTFNDGNRDLFSYWATSCGSQGSYQGNRAATLHLFKEQIPELDFAHLTSPISIGF